MDKVYGHEILTREQTDQFILDPESKCPECHEPMTQKDNPTGGDSWWFVCPNKHALWVGK